MGAEREASAVEEDEIIQSLVEKRKRGGKGKEDGPTDAENQPPEPQPWELWKVILTGSWLRLQFARGPGLADSGGQRGEIRKLIDTCGAS
jgi:hypothetical protein